MLEFEFTQILNGAYNLFDEVLRSIRYIRQHNLYLSLKIRIGNENAPQSPQKSIWQPHCAIEAIELFNEAKNKIDMVILDMIMPDLGGGAVFDHIKAAKQDIKVLLSTGYSLTGQAEAIMARGCTGVIQKPFNIEQLSAKIREILKTA